MTLLTILSDRTSLDVKLGVVALTFAVTVATVGLLIMRKTLKAPSIGTGYTGVEYTLYLCAPEAVPAVSTKHYRNTGIVHNDLVVWIRSARAVSDDEIRERLATPEGT